MRRKDVENNLSNYYRMLTLIHLYRNDFIRDLGSEEALDTFINEILDEINKNATELKKLDHAKR